MIYEEIKRKIFSIAPTFTCSKKCDGCYLTTGVSKTMRQMQLSTGEWIEVIQAAKSCGYTELAIALNPGGTNSSQGFRLVAEAKSLGLEVNVTTTLPPTDIVVDNTDWSNLGQLFHEMALLIDRRPYYAEAVNKGEETVESIRRKVSRIKCYECERDTYARWQEMRRRMGDEEFKPYYHEERTNDRHSEWNETNKRWNASYCPECHDMQRKERMRLGGKENPKVHSTRTMNTQRYNEMLRTEYNLPVFPEENPDSRHYMLLENLRLEETEVILDNLTFSCDDIHGYKSLEEFEENLEGWMNQFQLQWTEYLESMKIGRREIVPIGGLTINLLWTPVVIEWFMENPAGFKATMQRMLNYEGEFFPDIVIHHLMPKPLDCFGDGEELMTYIAEIASEHQEVGILGEHENTLVDSAFGHFLGLNDFLPSEEFDMLDVDPLGNVRRCPENPEILVNLVHTDGFSQTLYDKRAEMKGKYNLREALIERIELANKKKIIHGVSRPCGCLVGKPSKSHPSGEVRPIRLDKTGYGKIHDGGDIDNSWKML